MISAARLRELLTYDSGTGVFTWRADRGGWAKAGAVAGTNAGQGYLRISVDGVIVPAHRLAWLYVHGEMPKGCIDHINGDRSDNRITNLRDVSGAINTQNQRRARRDNKTGLLGVCLDRSTGKFVATIFVDGRNKNLGSFNDPAVAHEKYLSAKREMHAGCTI